MTAVNHPHPASKSRSSLPSPTPRTPTVTSPPRVLFVVQQLAILLHSPPSSQLSLLFRPAADFTRSSLITPSPTPSCTSPAASQIQTQQPATHQQRAAAANSLPSQAFLCSSQHHQQQICLLFATSSSRTAHNEPAGWNPRAATMRSSTNSAPPTPRSREPAAIWLHVLFLLLTQFKPFNHCELFFQP